MFRASIQKKNQNWLQQDMNTLLMAGMLLLGLFYQIAYDSYDVSHMMWLIIYDSHDMNHKDENRLKFTTFGQVSSMLASFAFHLQRWSQR